MQRRRAVLVAIALAVSASLLGSARTAAAQETDTEFPILTAFSRQNPATEGAPTTLRYSYTVTDADPDVEVWLGLTNPHGALLFAESTGKTGVLEIPFTTSSPAGSHFITVVGVVDGSDAENGAWYLPDGSIVPSTPASTGPAEHGHLLQTKGFTLTQSGPPPWYAIPLEPLTVGQDTFVRDVNADRTSVGSSGGPMGTPVKWNLAGAPTNLPVPAGCSGTATEITDEGAILGRLSCNSAPADRWISWFENGTNLTVLPGIEAEDTDDIGRVAGRRDGHAAYAAGATITDLEDSTATASVGRAMTGYGYVVGEVTLSGHSVATGWFTGHVFPLWDPSVSSTAVDVNHLGYALLQIETEGATHGALVGPGPTVILLDGDGATDTVLDLNAHGVVVGVRTTGEESFGLFYLGPDTVLRIDDLVRDEDVAEWGTFDGVVAVNDGGATVGNTDDGRSWIVQPPPF